MTDLETAIARALAPKAWATKGAPPGHDTSANRNRRMASLRHARIALTTIHAQGCAVVPVSAESDGPLHDYVVAEGDVIPTCTKCGLGYTNLPCIAAAPKPEESKK